MAINEYLPHHMIFKILSLLPVISLLRCKSVCKYWLSIISDPHFIKTHLNISNIEQPSLDNIALVLNFNVVFREQDPLSVVFFHSGEHTSHISLPPHFNARTRVIAYCNGLVCLSDYFCEVFCVWNPSIKRFKMLPPPNKTTECISVKLGFGYDSVSDDYKLVRILLSNVSNVVEAELYSVNADCWKEIELPKAVLNAWPYRNFIPVHALNGVLYMVNVNVLVSFDLHTEVFEVYPYPDSVKSKQNLTSLVFEGSIAMIFKIAFGDGSLYSLWTLDDDCGKVCWTKKFNFEPDLEVDQVDLYMGGGQFVALDFRVHRFFLYDNMKKETKRLLLPVDDRLILSCFKHTESLVSLHGFEQVECNGPTHMLIEETIPNVPSVRVN